MGGKFSLLVETPTLHFVLLLNVKTEGCMQDKYLNMHEYLESPSSPCKMSLIELYICVQFIDSFCFDVIWKRLHENLFCSSSTLSQFPGRKRLIGCNVRPISVSIPLFPCVNALPSKNTASLCIFCVRRWVLSFFPPFF